MEPWVIYDGNRVAVYDGLCRLCEYAGKERSWCDGLWSHLLEDGELMEEFSYYLRHHAFLDNMKTAGYSLTDLYVQQLDRFNISRDSGKNTAACNKEEMVLEAFETMAGMRKEPERTTRKWKDGFGKDQIQ